MNVALREPWSVDRFLAWEDRQEGRHEFDGERVVEMTGGTRRHQRIVHNIVRLLEDLLPPEQHDVMAEMRVVAGSAVRYPDVAVCAGRIPDATKTLRDAVVVVEVLSDETGATDRLSKRAEYARLPGLRHYLLVEQERRAVARLDRTLEGWSEVTALTDVVELPAIGVALPLAAIYRGIDLPPPG
jgi:Uma2 family endonuclease